MFRVYGLGFRVWAIQHNRAPIVEFHLLVTYSAQGRDFIVRMVERQTLLAVTQATLIRQSLS